MFIFFIHYVHSVHTNFEKLIVITYTLTVGKNCFMFIMYITLINVVLMDRVSNIKVTLMDRVSNIKVTLMDRVSKI